MVLVLRYELQVTGAGGVPSSGVAAVALNVTAVSTEANDFGGFVTVYPCGTRPDASNLNFTVGSDDSELGDCAGVV
jgi:hypothetical protein